MKKQSFRYILGTLPFIAAFNVVIAQSNETVPDFNNKGSKELAFNTKIKDAPSTARSASALNINARAVKNFSRNYKSAVNESWYVIEDGTVAEFESNGIKTKVFYTPKGSWLAMVRYYQEDKLPRDVRHQVKSQYYDFSIVTVIEVNALDKTAYLVKLDGKTSIKTIRVIDGEMDEYEAFDKCK